MRCSAILSLNELCGIALPLINFGTVGSVRADEVASSAPINVASRVAAQSEFFLFRTKQCFWREVIESTITRTEPAQDDYEKPSGLPSITINRTKANLDLLKKLEPAKRLKQSVFGQLMVRGLGV